MASDTQVFNGRYEIVRQLARGGMADVFLAHDLLLDRPVALKVLFRELSVDPTFVERFRREAQRAANLTHPNIVSVYDWGEEDGTYFIVMEYVEGQSLATVLRQGPLPADRAADVGVGIATALAFAHRSGVVHRDVKPGNVMIDAHGSVKVADFGIARAANTSENLTQPGAVMGTATYFSPEQAQGDPVDQTSDVYSLGVVLYEMVTGAPPFSGDSPVAIAYKHVREEPVAPRDRNPSIPPAFEAVVLRAMAKQREARYASADDLRDDLVRFRQGRPVSAPPPAPTVAVARTAPAPRTRVVDAHETAVVATPVERRTGAYLALLFVLLAVLVGLLFLLGRTLGLVGGGTQTGPVELPTVIGDTAAEARTTLEGLGLTVTERAETNDTAQPGVVFHQEPPGGTRVARGSAVTIVVSQAAAGTDVPDVVNESATTARRLLERAGFVVEEALEASTNIPAGTVMSQDPQAGEQAPAGSTVRIAVSSGKPKSEVPDVSGLDRDEAASRLGQAGFNVARRFEFSDDVEPDKVIRTEPPAGTQVDQGSTVTMVVSQGERPADNATVPDTVGMTEAQARQTLQDAGFRVRAENMAVTDPDQDGIVLGQSPRAGTQAPKGSTVTITVGRFAGGGGNPPGVGGDG